MLTALTIKDFAIVGQLSLGFGPGLNVLTGETGSGKSIVVDAVALLAGGRASSDAVRDGAQAAWLEAVFDLGGLAEAPLKELADLMGDSGLPFEDLLVVVSREISSAGRGVARVNGRAVPVSTLQQLGAHLVEMHGQGEHLALYRASEHVEMLDRFAGLLDKRQVFRQAYERMLSTRRQISSLDLGEQERAHRLDLLRFQVNEIGAAALREGEDAALEDERRLLANAAKLTEATTAALDLLDGADGGGPGGAEALVKAVSLISTAARLDPTVVALESQLRDLSYQLADALDTLRRYHEGIVIDPRRLDEVEERLDLIRRLKRKYGTTIESILEFGESAQSQLDSVENSDEELARLRERADKEFSEALALASDLSRERSAAGKRLADTVERELADLSMPNARFEVAVQSLDRQEDGVALGPKGLDRVEFLFSANAGEPLKPLARVASGGEASRVMLAVKTVLTKADPSPTLVFDEIDAGIGGATGVAVGRKLADLGRRHQVLCVTHLPQIAAFADRHFRVSKSASDGRTTVEVEMLEGQDVVAELGTMLGGMVSEAALANASSLLSMVGEWKER